MTSRLYGKYRATVTDNADPLQRCRIQVTVPSLGEAFMPSWAEPCVPVAGPNSGIAALPPIDAAVWIEFEEGDPDRPIWVGGFWTATALPPDLGGISPNGSAIVLQSADGTRLSVSNGTGGFSVRIPSGGEITIDAGGIRLSNGQGATIELVGPTVTVNGGALEVQ